MALQPRHPADVRLLLGQHERDAGAAAAGAAGAADPVGVGARLFRRVEVDHVRDVVDVEAAGGDVGGDERAHLARVEAGERLLPLGLRLVAVDRDGVDVVPAELLDEAIGSGLRPHEHECKAAVVRQQPDERLHLVVDRDRDEQVVDLAR